MNSRLFPLLSVLAFAIATAVAISGEVRDSGLEGRIEALERATID